MSDPPETGWDRSRAGGWLESYARSPRPARQARANFREISTLGGAIFRQTGSDRALIAIIRPVNETRMRARWKLGGLLKEEERGHGPGRGKKVSQAGTSFRALLGDLNLDKSRALD